ncbi:MAG: Mur ligase [Gammaproteobacteria bacterium]|nr:Mur ligase [Gammaproteobacteria bacterium]
MLRIDVDESRRLTGPNLLSDNPGAVMEVFIDGVEFSQVIALWKKYLQQLLASMNLEAEIYHRSFSDGANLGFSADEDMLYTACEINEAAIELARAELSGEDPDSELTSISRLQVILKEERNPQLMNLISAANDNQVTYLVDDDEFSLGMGNNSQCWAIAQLPDITAIDWSKYMDIPVALITGTNGKSTSVRMCDAIVKASGISAGITSTDYIRAADTIIDRGDYSGPGGARTLIRDHRVELAMLEVARGGMLRRGIGTSTAKTALITNVADDHLGQYGINTVAELIAVKAIVARSLSADGTLVVNADDEGLVEYFQQHPELIRGAICWFSLNAENEKIIEQRHLKQACVWLEDKQILLSDKGETKRLVSVVDIPTTMNGAAKHNVSNSMGAAALCYALNINFDDIATGLKNFKGDNKDNPGRGNYFDINKATVLIDFAHNSHSLSAVIDTVAAIPAKRRLITLGHAGDRTDRDITNLTDVATKLNPDAVVITELADYLRGRELGDVPAIIKQRCLDNGINSDQIFYAKSSLEGAKLAIEWAQPGDFVLLLVLDQRDAIFQYIETLGQVN